VVALRHGREYVGCELNSDYLDMSEKRLEAERMALDLQQRIAYNGVCYSLDGERITQKDLSAATKKLGISGRRLKMLLDDARAAYAEAQDA